MIINRFGGETDEPIPWGWSYDHQIFGTMVCYAYIFILMVQLLGLTFGDNFPIQVKI